MAAQRGGDPGELAEVLATLSQLNAPSGDERALARHLRRELGDGATVDALGNMSVRFGPDDAPLRLVFMAHMDEVSFVVSHVAESGLLYAVPNALVIPQIALGSRLSIIGKNEDTAAVAVAPPAHLQSDPGFGSMRGLWLFTGRKLGEETVGDPVCYDTVPRQLGTQHFTGKALDNRVGCALLLALAKALRDGALVAPGCRIDIGFTVQEEIGAHGAELLVKRLDPTIAVVVDTVTATDGVFSDRTSSNVQLGHGPVLRRFDVIDFSRHIPAGGSVYSRRLVDLAYGCAQDAGIPVQRDVAATWTDAAKVCGAGIGGVLSLGLFVPRWGSHSPVEVIDLRDVQAAEQLIIAVIRKLSSAPAGFATSPW